MKKMSLSDYENRMSLDSAKQLQAMNEMMKKQFAAYPITTAMVFGIAGGNGLEHVNQRKYKKIYGIDINEAYLAAVKERYSELGDTLECRRIDIIGESDTDCRRRNWLLKICSLNMSDTRHLRKVF